MIYTSLRTSILMFTLCCSFALAAQSEDKPILVTVETLEREYYAPKEKVKQEKKATAVSKNPKDFYRHHKKLPKTFEGFVIELTTSDFPLNRDYHLFEQFGEVFYDQVTNQGYSYCIIASFSSEKSIEQYLENVVIHKAPEAKVVEYKNGKRLIK